MTIRALTLDDLEPYLVHLAAHGAESGRDGDVYFGPYGREHPLPVDEVRERTRERWAKPLDIPCWRRAWGGFDGDRIVSSASVAGGELPAGLHRVTLGMSVLRGHRRRGWGRRLLGVVVAWCRSQPSVAWLDLGVFADNLPARALYERAGFEVIGETRDRWRLDGHRVDEIAMTLPVE